jgi:hypothetical protein
MVSVAAERYTHEEGYVEVEETFQEVDGCVILESELTDEHEVVE